MDVIKLLRSKNRCLQRLLDASGLFLRQDKLGELDSFLRERETIFKAIDLYDRKITQTLSILPLEQRTPALVCQVQIVLAEKDRLVQAVITKDNEVMTKISEEKNRILDEIAASRKSREIVGKFKSSWVREAGEELDRKL